MKRPLGVTILAILCFVGACMGLLYTGEMALDQWQRYRSGLPTDFEDEPLWRAVILHPITILIAFFAFAVFFVRLGWGLWKLEDSARIGFAIYLGLNLIMFAAVEWLLYLEDFNPGRSRTEEWLSKICMIGITALITTYLFAPATKRAFAKTL